MQSVEVYNMTNIPPVIERRYYKGKYCPHCSASLEYCSWTDKHIAQFEKPAPHSRLVRGQGFVYEKIDGKLVKLPQLWGIDRHQLKELKKAENLDELNEKIKEMKL